MLRCVYAAFLIILLQKRSVCDMILSGKVGVTLNELGIFLRNVRNAKNLSLKAVQKATGISDSRLSRIENGDNTSPAPADLKMLSQLYQIDIIEIFLLAGYLTPEDLSNYQHTFKNVDKLSPEEMQNIQNSIYLFTKSK